MTGALIGVAIKISHNEDAKDIITNSDFSCQTTWDVSNSNVLLDSTVTVFLEGKQVDQFRLAHGQTITKTYTFSWTNSGASTRTVDWNFKENTSLGDENHTTTTYVMNSKTFHKSITI